ncbi:MAG: hypothetical protein Q4D76_18705 [Oscillospiraceae bacterium]|nr:hypothetical protein [Oscillospiraceae bacterium]
MKIKCDSEKKYNIFDDIPEDEMTKPAEVLIGKLDIMSETEFREISFDKSIED